MNEKQLNLILQSEDSIITSVDMNESLTQSDIKTSESFKSSDESSEATPIDSKNIEKRLIETKPLLIQSRRQSKR